MNANTALHLVRVGEVILDRGFESRLELKKKFGDLIPRVDLMINTSSPRYMWARTFPENAALFSVKWSERTRAAFTEYVDALVDCQCVDDDYIDWVDSGCVDPMPESVRHADEKAWQAGFAWLKEVRSTLDEPWNDPDSELDK